MLRGRAEEEQRKRLQSMDSRIGQSEEYLRYLEEEEARIRAIKMRAEVSQRRRQQNL